MSDFKEWINEELQLLESVSILQNDAELQPGNVIGFRVQNDPSKLYKTTGYTATEGEGYYVCRTYRQAQQLKNIGWGSHIIKLQFPPPQKGLPADTLPILQAWQHNSTLLFEPVAPTDSLWTKINKTACQKVQATEQNLRTKIDELVKELTKTLLQTGCDSVFVQNPGFFVLLNP